MEVHAAVVRLAKKRDGLQALLRVVTQRMLHALPQLCHNHRRSVVCEQLLCLDHECSSVRPPLGTCSACEEDGLASQEAPSANSSSGGRAVWYRQWRSAAASSTGVVGSARARAARSGEICA